jgi:hypothetical protein
MLGRLLMKNSMSDVEMVWDTGDTLAWSEHEKPDGLNRVMSFRERTGATSAVQLRWHHNGKLVTCPFPATVLPDLSGVVLSDEWHFQGQPREGKPPYPKHLRVLNPDGSLRVRVFAPTIDKHSKPEAGWVEDPRDFSARGIPFGSKADDGGQHIVVVEYDWKTGAVLRWINAAPWAWG